MKEIIAELQKVTALGYNPHQVFDDWLDLMLYSFLQEEDYYLAVVKRYRNLGELGSREIDYFKNACWLLMSKMKISNDELLGNIYMQWNLGHKLAGQYFTPAQIASFMAQITCLNGGERIIDPCCGAGILLVEACKLMSYEQLNHALFVAQDIDLCCVKMCALNFLFFNLNAYIIWGDSLKQEYRKMYMTTRSYLGGSIRELSVEEVEMFRQQSKPDYGLAAETFAGNGQIGMSNGRTVIVNHQISMF